MNANVELQLPQPTLCNDPAFVTNHIPHQLHLLHVQLLGPTCTHVHISTVGRAELFFNYVSYKTWLEYWVGLALLECGKELCTDS